MKYILRYIYMLLCEIKSVFIKNKVIRYLEKSSISDVQPVIAKLKNSFKLSVFPYNYVNEYYSKKIDVYKDKTCGLFYVMDEGRKLYFSKKFRFKFHVRNYYRNLCIEQDKRSPHCYTSDTFSVDNDSVLKTLDKKINELWKKYLRSIALNVMRAGSKLWSIHFLFAVIRFI